MIETELKNLQKNYDKAVKENNVINNTNYILLAFLSCCFSLPLKVISVLFSFISS